MQQRALGSQGLTVSAEGLGCMGMSAFYGPFDDAESTATLHRALDLGVTLFDTADVYGPHTNERLVGQRPARSARRGRPRHEVRQRARRRHAAPAGSTGRPSTSARRSTGRCSGSASTSSTSTTCTASTRTRRSRRPSARWASWSPRARWATSGSARRRRRRSAGARDEPAHGRPDASTRCSRATSRTTACSRVRELGIGFVPYSPLGRGFLSGGALGRDFAPDDWRRTSPRFQGENFAKNLAVLDELVALAHDKGVTPSQLALAWVLAQGEDVVPIPGTRRTPTSRRTSRRSTSPSPRSTWPASTSLAPVGVAAGERYAPQGMQTLNH